MKKSEFFRQIKKIECPKLFEDPLAGKNGIYQHFTIKIANNLTDWGEDEYFYIDGPYYIEHNAIGKYGYYHKDPKYQQYKKELEEFETMVNGWFDEYWEKRLEKERNEEQKQIKAEWLDLKEKQKTSDDRIKKDLHHQINRINQRHNT